MTNNRHRFCTPACSSRTTARRWRARWRGTERGRVLQKLRSWENTSRGRGWTITKDAQDYVLILARDPCVFCSTLCEEIDHIEAGESNEWDNLTATCRRCNRSKHEKSLLLAMCRLNGAWYRDRGVLEVGGDWRDVSSIRNQAEQCRRT